MEYYKPYVQVRNILLPLLFEGQTIAVKKVCLKDSFTKPPLRYNPRSLLKKMEKEEIGTKATRATIIQTLYDRKYVEGEQSITVTDLGFEVTEVLRDYCPRIVCAEMTRTLEEKMEQIRLNQETRQNVLADAIEALRTVTLSLKQNQLEIGAQLGQKIKQIWLNEQSIGNCPRCQTGKLVIIRSKKSGKRFVGCTSFFEGKCNTSFPLPQRGMIKPLASLCKICGYPVVRILINSKRVWKLCLNPNCSSTKEQKNSVL